MRQITVPTPLTLPEILEPCRAEIEATLRPCVRITPTLADDTGPLDSKFGGYPYLPIGAEYPKDEDGKPMALLAQINFAEVPHIDPYPEKGILQAYFQYGTKGPDLYGLDFRNPTVQKNWRILWHPEPDAAQAMTDFSFLPDDETLQDWTPMGFYPKRPKGSRGLALRLRFERFDQPVTTSDYQFFWLLRGEKDHDDFFDRFGTARYDVWKLYDDAIPQYEHQIGGYAGFAQEDPRAWNAEGDRQSPDPANPSMLLLQIGSDEFFCWGDVGIANFIISRQDLINRDFSHVRYNWDCG